MFDAWTRERWYEKDALMETYTSTGRFPAMASAPGEVNGHKIDFIETEVRTKHWWDFLRIFVVIGVFSLLGNIVTKIWFRFTHLLG